MQKIFLKRTIRDLRENLFRYLALFLLIILCMFMVVGIVGAAQSVIGTVNTHADETHLEDGQFGVFRPLAEQEKGNWKTPAPFLRRISIWISRQMTAPL